MTKWDFVRELQKRLNDLPQPEINRYVDEYLDRIEWNIRCGMTEERAVEECGTMDEIERRIRGQQYRPRGPIAFLRRKVPFFRRLRPWQIVLIAVGCLVLLSPVTGVLGATLAITMASLARGFAVLLAVGIILLALLAAGAAIALGGLWTVIGSPFAMASEGIWYGLFSLGMGLFALGGGCLLCWAAIRLTVWTVHTLRNLWRSLRNRLKGRRRPA